MKARGYQGVVEAALRQRGIVLRVWVEENPHTRLIELSRELGLRIPPILFVEHAKEVAKKEGWQDTLATQVLTSKAAHFMSTYDDCTSNARRLAMLFAEWISALGRPSSDVRRAMYDTLKRETAQSGGFSKLIDSAWVRATLVEPFLGPLLAAWRDFRFKSDLRGVD